MIEIKAKRKWRAKTMTKAKVNGVSCVIYDYEIESNGGLYCTCYFPEMGYRLPVLASLIEVEHE